MKKLLKLIREAQKHSEKKVGKQVGTRLDETLLQKIEKNPKAKE